MICTAREARLGNYGGDKRTVKAVSRGVRTRKTGLVDGTGVSGCPYQEVVRSFHVVHRNMAVLVKVFRESLPLREHQAGVVFRHYWTVT